MFVCLSLLPVLFLSFSAHLSLFPPSFLFCNNDSYVGEWEGLTANKAFEQRLQRQWTLEKRIPLPNFGNQTSELFVFRKRAGVVNSSSTDTDTTAASYVKSVHITCYMLVGICNFHCCTRCVLVVYSLCTRCVTFTTDTTMNIHARITLGVALIRAMSLDLVSLMFDYNDKYDQRLTLLFFDLIDSVV